MAINAAVVFMYGLAFASSTLFDVLRRGRLCLGTLMFGVTWLFVLVPSPRADDGVFWLLAWIGIFLSLFFEPHSKCFRLGDKLNNQQSILWIIRGISMCVLFVMFLQVFEIINRFGGLSMALQRSRVDEYLSGGILRGSLLSGVVYAFFPFLFFYMGALFQERNRVQAISIYALIIFYLILKAETRLPIIFVFALPFYFMYFSMKPVSRVFWGGVGGTIGAVIFVAFVNFGAMVRSGVGKDLTWDEAFSLGRFTEQLGYRGWVFDLVSHFQNVSFDYCYQWFVAPLINFIPRAFWSEKPITSSSNRLHELVAGFEVGDGNYITTYTIFGEGYFQLGYLGVVLAPILLVILFRSTVFLVRNFPGNQVYLVWTLFRYIPFIRAELPIFAFLVLMVEVWLINFIARLRWM